MDQTIRNTPRVYYGWYIVATFMFIALVINGARASFGNFVIPMSEEFGWDRGTISFAAALGALLSTVELAGLSPRGRGNLPLVGWRATVEGSIPAWAGEPGFYGASGQPPRVYPRVGGGTLPLPWRW